MVTYKPKSIGEALNILNTNKCIIFAGGTDLMVKNKNWSGVLPQIHEDLMFLDKIECLSKINIKKESIEIGAACTLSQIVNNSYVPCILKKAASEMAAVAVRNIATIGGNICNASPAGDMLPPLYALNAKLEVCSINKTRIVSIVDFIKGPGRNVLDSNEIITKIIIPNYQFTIEYYKKVGTRKSTALSKLSFVGLCNIKDNSIKDIRIAFGAVAPTIVYNRNIEEDILNDKKVYKAKILEKYNSLINPIDDQRSSSDYRRTVSLNLLGDFLDKINLVYK